VTYPEKKKGVFPGKIQIFCGNKQFTMIIIYFSYSVPMIQFSSQSHVNFSRALDH